MIRDALLAAGLVLSLASQLTLHGAPFGIGEVCLALWILWSLARALAGAPLVVSPALVRMAIFWATLTFAIIIGLFVGYFTEYLALSEIIHDTVAYSLVASLTCLAAAEPDAPLRLHRCAWLVVIFADVTLLIQSALAAGWIHRAGIEPWYWDRMRGWSENPNQLALYCAIFCPLAIYVVTTAKARAGVVFGWASFAFAFYIGRLTRSDTFLYATIVQLTLFGGLRLRALLTIGGARAGLGRQIAFVLVLSAPLSAMAASPFAAQHVKRIETFAKSLTKDKGGEATVETADLRLLLWTSAIQRGLRTGSLGLGPGAHMKHPGEAEYSMISLPFEAHDTLLDIYTQGGLLLVLALIWLGGSALIAVWRAQIDALVALMASVGVFSLPHLIIRHPIVWFAVLICLVQGYARTRSQATGES